MSKRTSALAKRGLDLVGAAGGLVLTLPVLGLAAAAIKLEDPAGPVLFRQLRAGRHGRPFGMLKFRTMRQGDAAQRAGTTGFDPSLWRDGVPDDFVYKGADASDPRVTRVGAFLRQTSIDELPQLWNVLVGQMSLVGPRPEVLPIAAAYSPAQRRRLDVAPGVTGYSQVRGRADANHGEKIAGDLFYVEHASLALDLRILLATVGAVLRRDGAH